MEASSRRSSTVHPQPAGPGVYLAPEQIVDIVKDYSLWDLSMCSWCMLSSTWAASFASEVASYKATRRLTSVVNVLGSATKVLFLPGWSGWHFSPSLWDVGCRKTKLLVPWKDVFCVVAVGLWSIYPYPLWSITPSSEQVDTQLHLLRTCRPLHRQAEQCFSSFL